MPVGKNSIKRVANNGYSKVASAAPDMENSTVTEAAVKEEAKVEAAPVVKAPAKKPSAAKSGTKASTKKPAAKKSVLVKEEPLYVNVGRDLPVHLL